MANTKVKLVLVTVPNEDSASHIAAQLVEKKLAACVNIIPEIRSIYRWKGKIEDDNELLLVIKTSSERYPQLETEILEVHPYDNPEVIALDISEGAKAYCSWVLEQTSLD